MLSTYNEIEVILTDSKKIGTCIDKERIMSIHNQYVSYVVRDKQEDIDAFHNALNDYGVIMCDSCGVYYESGDVKNIDDIDQTAYENLKGSDAKNICVNCEIMHNS